TWSDGKASIEEMAVAARGLGYDYVAICDHTPNVRVVPGLDADGVRAQAVEIAAANERLAPFRVLHGIECDIRSDGTLDLPDDVPAVNAYVCGVLRKAGYQVEPAADLAQAAALARAKPLDVLVSDVVLGPVDGLDVEEAVRVIRPAVKTIFMSGYAKPRYSS